MITKIAVSALFLIAKKENRKHHKFPSVDGLGTQWNSVWLCNRRKQKCACWCEVTSWWPCAPGVPADPLSPHWGARFPECQLQPSAGPCTPLRSASGISPWLQPGSMGRWTPQKLTLHLGRGGSQSLFPGVWRKTQIKLGSSSEAFCGTESQLPTELVSSVTVL